MNYLVQRDFETAVVSFEWIPFDVLEQHIFIDLSPSSLMACSLVCSQFRKLSSRRLSQLPKGNLHQHSILQDIFRNGWANLLSWFQAHLRYPSMAKLSELRPALLQDCLALAAEGSYKIFIFYIF